MKVDASVFDVIGEYCFRLLLLLFLLPCMSLWSDLVHHLGLKPVSLGYLVLLVVDADGKILVEVDDISGDKFMDLLLLL